MALGQTNAAQVIVCKNKGWDPTKIDGGGDISGFDVQPQPWEQRTTTVGRLPESIPEGQLDFPGALDQPSIDQKNDVFNHPDVAREGGQTGQSPRATTNANPYPGGRQSG